MAGCFVNGSFSMGKQTLSVPMELFAVNRRRLCEALRPKVKKGVVLLQGGSNINLHCSDVEYVFQQEAYFHWMFGVIEPDFYGCVDVDSGKSVLFCPRVDEAYVIFMGKPHTCDDFKKAYGVDCVFYVDENEKQKMYTKLQQQMTLSSNHTSSAHSSGYAMSKLILDIARGIQGLPHKPHCAYVRSDVFPPLKFFASPLLFGPDGVKTNLGMPKLNHSEIRLLDNIIPKLKIDIDMGKEYASTPTVRSAQEIVSNIY